MDLKKLVVNVKEVWVDYAGLPGFRVKVANLSRKELNNLVRSSGGALGILSRGGSRQDVARHLSRMNRTKKNSKLLQAAIDSYSDYKNPPRNNPFI